MMQTSIIDSQSREKDKDHEAIGTPVTEDGSPTSNSRTASMSDTDLKSRIRPHRVRARVQFATLCWTMYLAGWNDGSTGPLLPRIQKVYNVSVLDTCSISEVNPLIAAEFCCRISDIRVCMCCMITPLYDKHRYLNNSPGFPDRRILEYIPRW